MMLSHYEHLVTTERMGKRGTRTPQSGGQRATDLDVQDRPGHSAWVVGACARIGGSRPRNRRPDGNYHLGGLLTSTALNFLVLPTLALWYGKFTAAATNE